MWHNTFMISDVVMSCQCTYDNGDHNWNPAVITHSCTCWTELTDQRCLLPQHPHSWDLSTWTKRIRTLVGSQVLFSMNCLVLTLDCIDQNICDRFNSRTTPPVHPRSLHCGVWWRCLIQSIMPLFWRLPQKSCSLFRSLYAKTETEFVSTSIFPWGSQREVIFSSVLSHPFFLSLRSKLLKNSCVLTR